MKRLITGVLFIAVLYLSGSTPSYARYDCGRVQRSHFGIADKALNLALMWARKFPHTSAREGVVVVQRRKGKDSSGRPGGHVSRIVRMTGTCSAIVADEKGQYERNICKSLVAYVDPNGSPGINVVGQPFDRLAIH